MERGWLTLGATSYHILSSGYASPTFVTGVSCLSLSVSNIQQTQDCLKQEEDAVGAWLCIIDQYSVLGMIVSGHDSTQPQLSRVQAVDRAV